MFFTLPWKYLKNSVPQNKNAQQPYIALYYSILCKNQDKFVAEMQLSNWHPNLDLLYLKDIIPCTGLLMM